MEARSGSESGYEQVIMDPDLRGKKNFRIRYTTLKEMSQVKNKICEMLLTIKKYWIILQDDLNPN